MSAIGERMPVRVPRGRFAGVGLLNAVLAAVLAGAGIAAYLLVTHTSTPAAAVRTASVQRGVVLSTVSATGSLQSARQISAGFTTGGTLASVAVKPGQHVRRGQVLGRIDATTARQGVTQAEASLASANAQYQTTLTGETAQQRHQDALSITQSKQQLAQAKASLAAQKRTAALDRKSAAASIAQAQRQLGVDQGQLKLDLAQRTQDQAKYPSVAAAQAAVAADQSALATAQAKQQADQQTQLDAQHQQSLDKTSLQTAQQTGNAADIARYNAAVLQDQNTLDALQKTLQTDGFAISQAQSALSADQTALNALKADESAIRTDEQKIASDNQSIASAKSNAQATAEKDAQAAASSQQQVKSAQLGIQTALASVAAKQAPPTPAALAGAKASVLQAQISLATARKALADTTLRAPIAGVVASVSGTPGTVVAGGGSSDVASSSSSSSNSSASSAGSSGFVTLTKLTGLQIVASFSETDSAKLRVGQPATVTVDALPDQQLAAHVVAISPTAATSSSSVVTYDATFALDRTNVQLKPGMTANIEVVTGEQDGVLHVPTAAVTGTGTNGTVTVLRNGVQQRVPVVMGLKGDSATAILDGLKANDTVVLPTVSIASTGSTDLGNTGTSNSPTGRTRNFGGLGGGGGFSFGAPPG